MATFQLQPAEDTMEVSTPGHHDDLDFLDDDMQDDANTDHEMRDDPAKVYDDEDLIDYSDDEDYLTPTTQTAPVLGAATTVTDAAATQENTPEPVTQPVLAAAEEVVTEESTEAEHIEPAENDHAEEALPEPTNGDAQPEEEAQTAELANGTTEYDSPSHDTDTGLHPITFYYNDQTYALFKSKNSPGLLKDDNLVSVSLADFIKNCRQRLIIKGHEIGDHLEIFLTFENVRLTVCEDTPAAFQTSLKDVLDTFVLLHENEGYQPGDIPPLEITCETQMKFNNSIVLLQQAAERGEGFSSVVVSEDDIQHDDQPNYDGQEEEYDETAYAQDDAAQDEEVFGAPDEGVHATDFVEQEHDKTEQQATEIYEQEPDTEHYEADTSYHEHDDDVEYYTDKNGETQVYDPFADNMPRKNGDDATGTAAASDQAHDQAQPAEHVEDDAAQAEDDHKDDAATDAAQYEDELLEYSDDEDEPVAAKTTAVETATVDDLIDYSNEDDTAVQLPQSSSDKAGSLTNGSSAPTNGDGPDEDFDFLDENFLDTPKKTPNKRAREPEDDTSAKKARVDN